MEKKLEGNVLDLECNLEHANAANAETRRNIKTYQLGLREAQSKLEGKQLSKKKAHDTLIVADRKYNSNHNALKEASTLLEQTDRARRIVKQELADTNETLSEKKAQCAMIDAARLAKIRLRRQRPRLRAKAVTWPTAWADLSSQFHEFVVGQHRENQRRDPNA